MSVTGSGQLGPPTSEAHLHGGPRQPMVARLGMPGAGRAERSGPAANGRGRDVRHGRRAVRGQRGLWPGSTMKSLVSVGAGPAGRAGRRTLPAGPERPAGRRITEQLGA